MASSPFGYVLWALPNLLVGLAYLVFLKAPLKTKLLAALPSALFLAIPALGFSLAVLEISHAWIGQVIYWILNLLYIGTFGLVIYLLLRVKTRLHVLQAINVAAGTLIWYVVTLIVSGDLG